MRAFLILTLAAVTATIAGAGCGSDNTQAGGSAFIEANDVLVSSETGGKIVQQRFDEGTAVKLGDTLAIIDPSKIELDIASAEANRHTLAANLEAARLQVSRAHETESFARSERDRVAKLLKSGSATQKQMDQLEHDTNLAANARQTAAANVNVIDAQMAKQDADIARLRRQLQDAYVIAPSSGIVTEEYIDMGEVVAPGKAVAKISRLDTVWVKVYLPAGKFASVKVGDKATISTEAGASNYSGTVIWTSSEAEFTPKNVQTEKSRTNLVYAVKVSIPNSDGRLKIGMPVFVTVEES
jgi:HlyD family secretion protein